MNYIKELNGFKDWLLLNNLPTGAITLWYTLMALDNASGWKERFNAPNQVVQQLSGLSKQGVATARKELVENGLIRYEQGIKGKAPIYQMVPFYTEVKQKENQLEGQQLDQSAYQSDTQDLTILKDKQKPKQNRGGGGGTGAQENPFQLYETNFGILKPILRDSLISWCDDLGDDMVSLAIKIGVEKGGRTFSFVDAILKEWVNANLKTVKDVKVYENQKNLSKMKKTVPFRKQARNTKQALFAELRREGKA